MNTQETFISHLIELRERLIRSMIAVLVLLGAGVLVHVAMGDAKVWMSALLMFLGFLILLRFGADIRLIPAISGRPRSNMLVPLGLIGGFVDATGGGGWGPVTTPTLLTVTKTEPRMVIGTVNAAEFIVATSATVTFLVTATLEGMVWQPVIGLILGGVIAAPIAAKLAGKFPHAPLGTLVGGLVVLTNANTIMLGTEVVDQTRVWVLFGIFIGAVLLAAAAWRREKADAGLADDPDFAG